MNDWTPASGYFLVTASSFKVSYGAEMGKPCKFFMEPVILKCIVKSAALHMLRYILCSTYPM